MHRIRLQLEALGLSDAEADLRRAIVTTCQELDIPHYLSVRQIQDIN